MFTITINFKDPEITSYALLKTLKLLNNADKALKGSYTILECSYLVNLEEGKYKCPSKCS